MGGKECRGGGILLFFSWSRMGLDTWTAKSVGFEGFPLNSSVNSFGFPSPRPTRSHLSQICSVCVGAQVPRGNPEPRHL